MENDYENKKMYSLWKGEFESHNAITDGHKNLGRNNNEEN